MNNYQQNNVSISSSIQVNFLSVTYVNIIEDSNIHKLISRLKVAQKEFQKCIEWQQPGHEVKSKALELSSILEAIMDSSRELPYEKRKDFCGTVVESACVVIEQYKDALSIEGFSEAIVDELFDYTQKFHEQHFGSSITDRFWFNLKCYEWFLKEGWVSRPNRGFRSRGSEYNYVFSEEQLEQFFADNRKEIIKIMLENNDEYHGFTFSSPLVDEDINQSFCLYNRILEVK
ncbi:hypothetical protein MH171_000105 [Vibrio parahaemolyticus]|uniref:hypothetical protein n=1 Tax=Vibrio parahaemolyticus TaxID=670 RepID=UPI0010AA05BE|nr:hypothetical protein [Vibrio parahaemolyticus]EIW7860212.1 hypothetical protein [Vibrio parahaemolyticus]ELA7254672.1 hypothetical protein [Vibrio parahaemolyticus]EMF1837889.1 hypothetical protein [Vibrio parahaemolyticus]MBE4323087.1 hypothetical protein [Vibrio parahaemolyticus]MBE4341231.1 hypothetical protein [Vibrio parahaemolyticus]